MPAEVIARSHRDEDSAWLDHSHAVAQGNREIEDVFQRAAVQNYIIAAIKDSFANKETIKLTIK
mgnify:CR=1 FL=1